MRIILISIVAVILAASSVFAAPPLCAISGTVYINSAPAVNARVTFRNLTTRPISGLGTVRVSQATVLTDVNGNIPAISLIQGIPVSVNIDTGNPQTFTVPAQSSANLTAFFKSFQ